MKKREPTTSHQTVMAGCLILCIVLLAIVGVAYLVIRFGNS